MQMALPSSAQDYLALLKRRKWVLLGVITSSLAIGATLCVVLPKSYRSTITILVESQRIPESYVKTVVEGTVDERIAKLKQVVMSRSLLLQVAGQFQLYEPGATPEELEQVVENMRRVVKVTTIDSNRQGRLIVEGFTISYAHKNPTVAMQVTDRLASLFIDQNLKFREQIVEGASEFLDREVGSAQEKLNALERAISEFKTRYVIELPEQKEANLRTLDRLQTELNTTVEAIHSLTARQSIFEKAVSEYELTGTTSNQVVAPVVNQPPQDPLVTRLNELQRQLATLTAEYKDTYPDISLVRDEIKELQAQITEKKALSQSGVQQTGVQQNRQGGHGKVFDPYLQNLLRQRDEARLEIVNLRAKEARINRQMKAIEGRVERTPTREQELAVLVRDYENQRRNYQSLLEKQLNARVAENLEKRQKGEQFRILDPANLPATPETPNRQRIMLLALVAGCGLGAGLVVLLEQYKAVFRRPEEIEQVVGFPVLATIPEFHLAYDSMAGPAVAMLSHEKFPTGSNSWMDKLGRSKSNEKQIAKYQPIDSPRLRRPQLNFVTRWLPSSIVAEQFRVAASRLALMLPASRGGIIAVTSALEGEGKSSIAINLAYTLSKDLGRSTLIVDCDFTLPMLGNYADVPSRPGLVDFFDQNLAFEACLQQYEMLPLWLLPGGQSGKQQIDLSEMRRLMDTIRQVRSRFDFIILDSPPILPLADMHVLASAVDILLLVVRAGVTTQSVVQQAIHTLKPSAQCGVILNGGNAEPMSYYMTGKGAGSAYFNHVARQIPLGRDS